MGLHPWICCIAVGHVEAYVSRSHQRTYSGRRYPGADCSGLCIPLVTNQKGIKHLLQLRYIGRFEVHHAQRRYSALYSMFIGVDGICSAHQRKLNLSNITKKHWAQFISEGG